MTSWQFAICWLFYIIYECFHYVHSFWILNLRFLSDDNFILHSFHSVNIAVAVSVTWLLHLKFFVKCFKLRQDMVSFNSRLSIYTTFPLTAHTLPQLPSGLEKRHFLAQSKVNLTISLLQTNFNRAIILRTSLSDIRIQRWSSCRIRFTYNLCPGWSAFWCWLPIPYA